MRVAAALGTLALLGCSQPAPDPVTATTQPPHTAERALPVVLTYADGPALEAIMAGTLRRRGPCLFLDTGAQPALILWGDDVRAARLNEDDWLVTNYTTNQRFREGDFLQGAGGSLPESLDLGAVTPEEIPFECERSSAVIFYGVKKADPPNRAGGPPNPPPPPPPPPGIIEQVKNSPPAPGFPFITVAGIADPREALFAHVIAEYRDNAQFTQRTICLTDTEGDLVERLNSRFGRIEPDRSCGWKQGGVILQSRGESALFIHAKADCSGRECAAEGGATYGNLGGEGHGYRMRRKSDGWTIQKSGIMWIS